MKQKKLVTLSLLMVYAIGGLTLPWLCSISFPQQNPAHSSFLLLVFLQLSKHTKHLNLQCTEHQEPQRKHGSTHLDVADVVPWYSVMLHLVIL
jgi:hypothetical protein